ncbi:hypothetical protein AMS58_06375 [Pseudoalteromonas porphyrae]|uniref:Uncharacterized protein n=1 Tax=Pseudoalteromonas porphyrae TaxID=187330 RepID=A0A0N1EPV9_9GAMM|nr:MULTISPECIES: hypothetical protein [Pseudoalteromonas]KPH63682.1 hypothetical protein ADS77_07085 [Pseudoalteromonas porphyrae]KPH95347.1 hypothetical protein AMS58_06375 [Pseudoalteromonas porphyrae]NNG41990.1 hypothetical protein [Pseudoalteromonas sp. NEC-BIFX-2020_002]
MKKLIIATALLSLGYSGSTLAAHVECMINGTPTQQEYSVDHCSSTTNSPRPGVAFRFVSDRPIQEVTWSYSASNSGTWRCGTSSYCTFNENGRFGEFLADANACVTRVLYTDGTWENSNYCAFGIYNKPYSSIPYSE